jgi:hypothetical protein
MALENRTDPEKGCDAGSTLMHKRYTRNLQICFHGDYSEHHTYSDYKFDNFKATSYKQIDNYLKQV